MRGKSARGVNTPRPRLISQHRWPRAERGVLNLEPGDPPALTGDRCLGLDDHLREHASAALTPQPASGPSNTPSDRRPTRPPCGLLASTTQRRM